MRRYSALLVVAVMAVPGGAAADNGSLPNVDVGPRPGPSVLYADPPAAPQLERSGIWRAEPIMVSGVDAYDGGEYLYQDYVYDDYGANTTNGPEDPSPVPLTFDVLFGPMTGDVVYPTDAGAYVHNAADLLELRARLVPGGIAYRITLNSMTAPEEAGVAIGIDTDRNAATGDADWGYAIGPLGPLGLEHVVVTWGPGAELDGEAVSSSVDTRTRQIEVRVPLAPGTQAWRHYAVVGLFDAGAKAFKPVGDQPTATHPGGAHGTNPPPVFNAGFRFEEPMGVADKVIGGDLSEADPGSRAAGYGHWRDHAQAKALAARDISAFHADIDFGKLANEIDESHVPESGYLNLLYASRLSAGQGKTTERPMLRGQIQPYSAYVPRSKPRGGFSLHVVLHSLSCTYNQYAVFMPRMLTQLGEERGAIVLTTEGRGPDGWYHDEGEYDLFEAWGDLASRYDLNRDRATVSGYSMGGYGTYKMASQYPDLFAAGFAIVGPADENIFGGPTAGTIEDEQNTLRIADGLRNVPLLMWNGMIDELVPVAGVLNYERRLHELGYRHELDLFPTHDHFLFGVVDEWGPAKAYLARDRVDRDPARVTFRAMPEMDNADLGLVHDHAYWVGDVRVAGGSRSGLVDVRSFATGEGSPRLHEVAGAALDPSPHLRRGLVWGEGPAVAARNRLEVSIDGVSSVTLWVERAGIDPGSPIELVVGSSEPATVRLATRDGVTDVAVPAGRSEHRV